MKVLILPDLRKGNPYLDLLASGLTANGAEVSFGPLPTQLFGFSRLRLASRQMDVYHIHWIASLIQALSWSRSDRIFSLKLWLLRLDLFLAKCLGMKLVWTIHNKFAHQGYDQRREMQIRKVFLAASHQAIVHSQNALDVLAPMYGPTLKQKASVIPHGNYAGVYPTPNLTRAEFDQQHKLQQDDFVLLYFGAIRPHKGVEILTDAFRQANAEKVTLVLAGNCKDKAYIEALLKPFSSNPKVIADIRFIPDQELMNYLHIADAVVIPFADTLTSGSVILAMTMGKGLILPEKAKVFGCVPEDGVNYFADNAGLVETLQQLDKASYQQRGKANQQQADTLSWPGIGKRTLDVYLHAR